MRGLLLLFLTGFALAGAAEVYRWTDAEGVVHFGDQPVKGAETIKVPPMQVISPLPVEQLRERAGAVAGGPYSTLQVISPEPDEALRSNTGEVSIQLALSPALLRGHHLFVTVDGVERETPATTMNLSNLTRGGHTVLAQVKDARGKVLISSETVHFFVLRAARPTPAAPPQAPSN